VAARAVDPDRRVDRPGLPGAGRVPADGDVAGEPGGGAIERDPVVADAGLEAAAALADPALELRYALPGVGWVDERGRPTPAPEGEGGEITRAVVPGGGEVALVHGAAGAGDARLAEAAAAAAALALDSTRLEAAVQARAAEVRASRRRLLTAADAERRVLEAQLSEGPLAACAASAACSRPRTGRPRCATSSRP
jgi:hypothetical protein